MSSDHNGLSTLREWAPLTDLLSKVPIKSQNGIFFQDIKLTCVDILPEFIALGSNVGSVYWYDRRKKDMERLRCPSKDPITVLKIISTVDFMVACGNCSGDINIFQIPKSHPESIPESLKPQKKTVEGYIVKDIHKAPITAIEWSRNGMKLFTGDKNGCLVLTEMDYYLHVCKSMEILNESYEIVQLSYHQQRVLVSTTYRSIICENKDKLIVCQVGKKDRKVLGSYGGIISRNSYKPSDTCLYCTRPGLRMWISDLEGNVQKTLLFKDLLTTECGEVPIINPLPLSLIRSKTQKDPSFGILLPFNEKLLITYNNDTVYILDPEKMAVISSINHLRSVLSVATHKDEIFILEEHRSLIRVSYKPECLINPDFPTASSSNSQFLNSPMKDLTAKLQSSNIIAAISPIIEQAFTTDGSVYADDNTVMKAEEARESPVKIHGYNPDVQKKFDEIGKQDFEEKILFKKSKSRKKRPTTNSDPVSLSSNSSSLEKESSYTQPTVMNLSAVGVLPDLRSPESIQSDIEYKEKILADVLSLDKVKIASCSKENSIVSPSRDSSEPNCDYSNSGLKCMGVVALSGHIEASAVSKKGKSKQNKQTSVSGLPSDSETPDYMSIPKEWKLNSLELNKRPVSVTSDCSSDDWELV